MCTTFDVDEVGKSNTRVEFCFCFRWIKAFSVHSKHCRTMECRIGVTVVLGELDVAWVKPYQSGRCPPPPPSSAHGLVRIPPAGGGHPISGGAT